MVLANPLGSRYIGAVGNLQNIKPDPWVDEMIKASPVAAVVSNPRLQDNPIVACNQAFIDLTGYSAEEILGHNCRFLAGPDTEPWLTQAITDGVAERRPVMVEILNYKKDGTPFRNAVVVAPIFDDDDELAYFFGSQIELQDEDTGPSVTQRARAAEKIRQLSPRQLEVLKLVASGLRNKQIAWELQLSEKTVKMHRGLAMEKLGVQTAAEMIRIAVEAGI